MTDAKLQVVNELHAPARKNFKRRSTILKGIDDLFQADLAEFIPHARSNKGHKYILVVIDCFSKYLWTRALKTKTASEVTKAMQSIIDERRIPKNLQTDQGTEFFNSTFKRLMNKYGINHYHTYSVNKAAMCERVIRTIKEKLYKQFTFRGSYNWLKILNDVTYEYNHTRHRIIKMKPVEVTKANERSLLNTVFLHIKMAIDRRRVKFKVGDIVRISKAKHLFDKSYKFNWTAELFRIVKVQITRPVTYLIEDLEKKPVLGCFYEKQLQKTKQPDVYLVEKILKRKGTKAYVSWTGLPSTANAWINLNADVA